MRFMVYSGDISRQLYHGMRIKCFLGAFICICAATPSKARLFTPANGLAQNAWPLGKPRRSADKDLCVLQVFWCVRFFTKHAADVCKHRGTGCRRVVATADAFAQKYARTGAVRASKRLS